MANIGDKYGPEADYQRGLNDAWEAAKKIAGAISCGGLNTHELMEPFWNLYCYGGYEYGNC